MKKKKTSRKGKREQNSPVNKRHTRKRRVGWGWGYVVLLVAAAVADHRFGPRPLLPFAHHPSTLLMAAAPRIARAALSRFLFSSTHTATSHVCLAPPSPQPRRRQQMEKVRAPCSLRSHRGPFVPPPPPPPALVPSYSVLPRSAGTTQMFQTTSKASGCDEHIRTPSDVSDMPAALKEEKKKSGRLWPYTNLCLRQRPQEPKLEPLM